MGVTVKGADALQKQLASLAARAPTVAAAVSRAQADAILARSNELVPVDSGELRDSGAVVEDGRGGASVVYTSGHALVVHEDLSARHPNGGQAKFLETAVAEIGASSDLAAQAAAAALGGK
jgi:outer membrane receptor protein involved in Fe transport